ncbi:uncharacterized protein KY384_004962 [Bacidia gigantensis]|uniref:uncharacterized protein n=1 Tax=Bacidia gigantensis TaxID=2732470 RepID=UPI001D0394B9|nr:uncharacterized protein KY384_004962 [Bacidia gigantensis]KAG8530459.1 hypothetical protein KY384_004962 [Bacidia gigantensis]
MAEEAQTLSIRDRINAFQIAGTTTHLGRAPVTAKPVEHSIPVRSALEQRSQTTSVPISGRSAAIGIGNEPNGPKRDGVLPPPSNVRRTGQDGPKTDKPTAPPRLPPRTPSALPTPALPPRKPSNQWNRRASNESISSTISSLSSVSGASNGTALTLASRTSTDSGRIKAPPLNEAILPVLPPKRNKDQSDANSPERERSRPAYGLKPTGTKPSSMQSTKAYPTMATEDVVPPDTTPALPPRRPSRPEVQTSPARKLPPPADKAPPKPSRSALSYGLSKERRPSRTDGLDQHETDSSHTLPDSTPPPIPTDSRPDLSKITASKPKTHSAGVVPQSLSAANSPCLLCRDFSAVDTHAAKFPRVQVPSLDWLAHQLTSPFPSPTDKARAIFTWLHHNISYDTVSFFNGTVQPSTPASTLQSGLAVCEGYAGLFTAIASKIGLQSIVVGGHGKGFGFASIPQGSPIPPEDPSGHAWNAVKIDGGYWKLIDACWGAGNVSGKGQPYNKHFSPRMFTMPNHEFGLRHYPENRGHFFVEADGRMPPTWQEYFLGPLGGAEPLRVYSGVAESEGISEASFLPRNLRVSISPSAHPGPTVRFQFAKICQHWDPVRNGKGKAFVFILAIGGVDGREKDFVPFETNGHVWWCDVEARRLGCVGQTVSVYTVDTVNGQTGRGLSVEEYRQAKGRKGMGFGGLAAWELI